MAEDNIRSLHNMPIRARNTTEEACLDLERFIERARAGEFSIQFGVFVFLDAETIVTTYRVNEASKLDCAGLLAYGQHIRLNDR